MDEIEKKYMKLSTRSAKAAGKETDQCIIKISEICMPMAARVYYDHGLADWVHAIEHEKHKHRNEANDHNNDAVLLSSKSISKY